MSLENHLETSAAAVVPDMSQIGLPPKVVTSWCHDKSKRTFLVHQWTIENFSFYYPGGFIHGKPFSAFNDEDDDIYPEVNAPDVVVNENGELMDKKKEQRFYWSLKLNPSLVNRLDDKEYVAIYLRCFPFDDDNANDEGNDDEIYFEVKATFKFSILGADGKWHNTTKFKTPATFIPSNKLGWGTSSFILRDQLLNLKNELLPNDTLTIGCEIEALSNFVSISGKTLGRINGKIAQEFAMNNDYTDLWKSELFTDLVIEVFVSDCKPDNDTTNMDEGSHKKFHVHKSVISVRFPYIGRTLLKYDKLDRFMLYEEDPHIFEAILQFIYCGKVDSIYEIDFRLLPAANKYNLPVLKRMCERSLVSQLTSQTVANLFILAHENEANELKEKCIYYIRKHSIEVLYTDGWKRLLNEQPDLVKEIFIFGRSILFEKARTQA